MANSDKDIRVVPNRNKSGLPNIAFTGYNNDPIVLNVLDDNTISFEGSSGQLFSVSNAVTTGTIFSVNDISGIPSFRVDADGTVGIAEFSGNVGIGLQSPQSKLSVGGDINVGAGYTFRVAGTKVLDSSSLGTGVTGSSLTSVGTISSGTWQGTAIGVNYGGTGATNASDARSFIGAATAGTNSDLTRLLGVQHLFVTIPTAAAIGITVKAATSQAASMMEFVNSSNSLLAWITKDGTFAHGAYFTHNDGRVPGISVQRANAAGIVARGFNSDAFPAIEVQNNGGGLGVGLYPGGLVYGGVLQAWASTASTNTTTGALIVAGGAAIAGTTNFGRDVRIFSSLASSSPFTGSLVVSGGVGISNNLFVGGGVAFTSSIASTSTSTGTLVVTGGVGIGGSVFTSTSNASSISGVVLSNGSVTLTGTYTQSNSSTTAFQVRDGSNNPAFVIDTIGDVISLPVAVASTSTSSGSLVVAGGVGIGGTLNVGTVSILSDLIHNPGLGTTGGVGSGIWTTVSAPTTPIGGNLLNIKFLNNTFVGFAGTYFYYSDDGLNWNYTSTAWTDNTRSIGDIAYGNGVYVATQYYTSYAAYSYDAINWTQTNAAQYQTWSAVEFGNGIFLARCGGSVCGISTNGINWTSYDPSSLSYNQGLSFINGYFYETSSTFINRSVDGINWQRCNMPSGYSGTPRRVSYGKTVNGIEIYISPTYNSNLILYSYDGINFDTYTSSSLVYISSYYINGVFYAGLQSNNSSMRYSTDGFNWGSFSAPTGVSASYTSIIYAKNKLFLNTAAGSFYSYATPGKIDISPLREGVIDNVQIGVKSPSNAKFTSVALSGELNVTSSLSSVSTKDGALVVSGGVGIGGSLYVASATAISGVTINSGTITGNLTGTATTATYTHQSGYATTSGSSNTSGYATTSGLATTATYSHQSGYAITSGFAISSSTATLASSASTSYSVNVNSASTNASHHIIFSPNTSGSGVALSTESSLVYNPSTEILSVSGLAVTSGTSSTSTSTGTLVVTGGVGIGGSVFTSTSDASSISGVVLNNGSVTLTGTYTQSNSSTTAFQVRDGSNNPAFVIDTIGDVISLPVAVASTSTGTGSLVVAGGVGIGGTLNVNRIKAISKITFEPGTGTSAVSGWTGIAVTSINRMIYGGNRFVGVGGSYVAYSDDGINFTYTTIPGSTSGAAYNDVAYGNGVYVAVNTQDVAFIAYSYDGAAWGTTSIPRGLIRTVGFGNGKFLAFSEAPGSIYSSTDGRNWSTIGGLGGYGREVLYANGYFLSPRSTTLYYSVDGISWRVANTPNSNMIFAVTYGKSLYIAADYNTAQYYTSTDLVTWTQRSIDNRVWTGASYVNGVFYLIPNNNNNLYHSLDGINWSTTNFGTPIGGTNKMFTANDRLYFFSTYGPTLWSTDATTGTLMAKPFYNGELENTRIGAVNPDSATFTHLTALNNVTFTSATASTAADNGALTVSGGVGIGQTINVAGSVNVSNSLNLVNTTTGIATTWTRRVVGTGATISYLAYANNLYVGVGYSSITSTDGVNWTTRTLPNNLSYVTYGNGIWSGLLFNSALGATSTNGTSWTSYAMTNNRAWTMMAFGNGKFVTLARSTNIAAYSTNGYNWTEVTMPTSQVWVWVTYGGGYFLGVANASTTAIYSTDGINWTTTTLPSAAGWNSVTYGNGYFYVTGSSRFGAYSKDLINWTSYSTTIDGGALVAYNNGTFVVADYTGVTRTNIITGDFTSRTQIDLPGPQIPTALVAGDRVFIAGYGQTFYTFPIPNNSITLSPNTTGEINNVEIGNTKPASGAFSNIFSQGLVAIGATARSISPYTGALVVAGGVGIGGSLFVGNTLSVASSTASTSTTTGALIVSGGVGISGNINSLGRFNFGTLSAPTMGTVSGFGTGGLTPSTTYYYKLSAIDYNNNESLPSIEYSTTLSASQYGARFYIFPSPGAIGYKLYRTTTSGSYTNSFVQIYRVNQWINGIFYYDVGKSTSTGTPLSVTSGNTSTLGTSAESVSNVLPSLTIPTGTLQVKSPNFVGVSNNGGYAPAIETGTTDFVALRETFGYNGLVASTGGTLTPGQTYYYVATIVDHYGNESLPTPELAYTADAGGAVIIGFNVASVQIPAIRVYRTTTPGNYTNSYIGELPGNKDIGYPTMSGSPPTTTSFAGIRLNPRADFGAMSYIPNLDIAPSHRTGMLRKLDVPYTGAIAVTTSGVGGSLLPNTTYYYKCAAFDVFGNAAYPTAEVSVSTGTSTAVTISGGGGLIYAKVYRSTTKNNYSAVPTYYVNSFPFTDRGDTTFTDTPSNSSRYIQSQLFWNENNAVPQNYLRDLTVGFAGYRPFNILAPPAGINSVSASTGGTLVEGQVYYYIIEAVDIENFVSAGREPIRFTATAGGAANVSVSIVGSYGYVFYNLYRTSNLASWANSLIATGIKGSSFIDIGYPGRSGSPTFAYQRARNVIFDIAGTFHIPTIASQILGQNITATSAPYRTGGNSAGSLTTNTTYYYRVVPYGGANQIAGYASDEFQYTTGANERNISLTIGGHKIGAMYYRVYRSTTFNNFTNAYYFETPHINFTDYGHSTLQTTPDIGVLANPRNTTINLINQSYGNYLAYTTITGQSGGLKIHSKSPVITSITSGTGGTLATATNYWYKVEAVDVYGVRTFASDEAYINTASNNSVTLTWDDVPGAYYYVVYRATASQTFTNTRIASYVNARTFTDIGFSTSNVTPITIFQNGQNGATAALFQMDNAKYFGVMPRTIISNIDNTQTSWYTDFSLRITSPPVPSASGALLQVGAGFTNFSSAGFNGTTYGTQIAIGAAIGFTGSLLDAQTAGVSRFRINFDGSATIGSTTGSGSTSTGALVVSGGVGIGQSLFTSPSYSSSISGAIFNNGSATLSGTFTQNNSSTTAFQVRDGSNNPAFVIDTIADIISLPVAVASTSTGTGSLVVAGGVGIGGSLFVGNNSSIGGTLNIAGNSSIGGTLNISGNASIGGTLNVSGSNSYFQNNLYVGNNTQGRLYFSQATLGSAGTTVIPTMAFIGATNSPITLSVLPDNSLSFDGSSGQLFSINNNLSTGWIFSINDISGLPIFRTNADLTVAMGEYGGNVGIGLSNPTFKLQVSGNAGISGTTLISNTTTSTNTTSGALVVSGGVGIGGSLNVTSASTISGVTINSGVITGSLTGTATTATYANQSGYAITSGSSNTSGYATTAGLATTATYAYQSGYAITSGIATTARSVSVRDDTGGGSITGHPIVFTPELFGGAGVALSTSLNLYWSPEFLTLDAANFAGNLQGNVTGNVTGTATTATNVNIVSASTSASHPVLFTPASGTASGAALSTESSFVYNPSTDILSVSGLAVTSGTVSSSSTTGALIVSGGVGIGGSVFTSTSNASSISGVVLSNGAITNTGAITSTGVMTLSNSSTTAFQVRDGSNNARLSVDTIGGIVSVSSSTASTNTSTGALVVTGGVGIAKTSYFGQDVKILGTTASSNSNTGALTVAGGVGISGNLYVACNSNFGLADPFLANFTTNSDDFAIVSIENSNSGTTAASTLRAVSNSGTVWLGIGSTNNGLIPSFFGGNVPNKSGYLFGWDSSGAMDAGAFSVGAGSTLILFVNDGSNSRIRLSGTGVSISATTASTSSTSGALVVTGGAGIAKTSYFGQDVKILGSTASTSSTTGALTVSGGVGISGRLNVGPRATTYSNPSFTEVLAGFATSFNGLAAVVIENLRPGDGIFSSLILKNPGGNGIISYMHYPGFGETTLTFNNSFGGMSFYTDGGLYSFYNGPVSIQPNDSPASTSTTTGALRVLGGIGIGKTSYFGQDVKIQGTTSSGSTTTGALTVSGGVGIGQTLFTSPSYASSISGVILNNGAITNTGTITSTGVMSLSNSSTTALSIKDGSNSTKFNVDTIGGVVSVSSSTASTNTLTGALVVGGGLGVSGDLFVCSLPNSRLSVMNSSGDEGGEIFLNKPVTNTAINTGLTIDIYQNRLRFFEAGGSNRGFYLDIPSGGNSVGTNLLGGGSGTVSTLTAGTGISFSTGATITTTGTIRARRPLVASFCAGYTPAASGADSVVIRLPDSPSDGISAITYEPQEFHIRVETASATTTTIQLEKYTGTGAFSGTAITSVSISGGSTYEAQTSVFAGAGIFLTSGDKLRINFTALSASHANFSVYLELEEV